MKKPLLLLLFTVLFTGAIAYGQQKTILIFKNKEELKQILAKTEIRTLSFAVKGLKHDSDIASFEQNLYKFGGILSVSTSDKKENKRVVTLLLSDRFGFKVFRKMVGTNNFMLQIGKEHGDYTILDH